MWLHGVAHFFGGVFFVNGVPHFVSGVMGRKFPSPFASPPGKGLSSAVVNVLWGALNLGIGYWLVLRVGMIDLLSGSQMGVVGAGAVMMGLLLAHEFGKNPAINK